MSVIGPGRELDGRRLRVEIGDGFYDSRVYVDDEELACAGVKVEVASPDVTRISLEVLGTRLSDPVVVEGTLQVDEAH